MSAGPAQGYRTPRLDAAMALGHWFSESRRSAEAPRATPPHFYADGDGERSGPRVRLEIARNDSVGVLTSI